MGVSIPPRTDRTCCDQHLPPLKLLDIAVFKERIVNRIVPICIFAVTLASHLLAADYKTHSFPAGYSVRAINQSGQVTGTGNGQIFLWSRVGGVQYLGNESGGTSIPTSLNDNGQITGSTTMPDGSSHLFVWSQGAGFQDLSSPLAGNSENGVINSPGNVAGVSFTPDESQHHAMFWSGSTGSVDIGTLNSDPYSQPNVLNNNGEVAGISTDNVSHETAFSWTSSGGILALPSFGGVESWPNAINDSGDIAGWSTYGDGTTHAALWDGSGIHDLGTLAGDTLSVAVFLNQSGHIMGYSGSGDIAFFWTPQNGMTDTGSGPLDGIFGFNNQDEMVGQTPRPNPSIFVWSPTLGVHTIASGGALFGVGLTDSGQFFTHSKSHDKVWTPAVQVNLSSSQNPSQSGQSVTITANVSTIVGHPPDGEPISFHDGSKKIGTGTLTGGVATLTTSVLTAGTHNLTAKYPGDSIYYPSKSLVLQQVVNP